MTCACLPEALATAIPPLVADPTVLLPGHENGLTESEIARLQALAPRLQSLCEELSAYRIADTLERLGDPAAARLHRAAAERLLGDEAQDPETGEIEPEQSANAYEIRSASAKD